MKKQNKKIYTALLGVLGVACAASAFAGVGGVKTASAAVSTQSVYADDFNAEALSGDWTATNAQVKSEYSSLRVQPTEYSWPAHILCSGYKLERDCRLEVKLQELPTENASWFSLSFGSPSTITIFEKASGALIFSDDYTMLFKEGANTGTAYNFSPIGNLVGNGPATVILEFAKRDNGAYNITYTVKANGGEIGTAVIENFAVQDGYFGFNTYGMHFDVLSFDAYEGGERVYADDFTASAISHDENVVKGSEWVASAPFTRKSAAIAPVGQLDISEIGANVVYKDAFVTKSSEVSVLYEISAKFDFSNADVGVASGFEIAKATAEAEGVFVGLIRKAAGYSVVLSDGDNKQEILLGGNPSDGIWSVSVAANYDYSLEVTTNGFTTTFELDCPVDGYFGVTTSDDYATSGKGALVDDFSFERYIYTESQAMDAGMNFEGTREFEDEDGKYYQYYFPTKDWYAGSNVRVANHGFTNNGYVLFGNASVDSSFGPKQKYSDCIVRFDVTLVGSDYYYDNPETYFNTPTGAGACDAECFGLQFGSKSYKNNYVNAQSLGVATYHAKSVYYTTNCTLAGGTGGVVYRANAPYTAENEYDLFRKSATYNFMYVIKNGTVTMHFKEASEDESVLGIVREKVTGVETNGYVAVYGSNGVDFRLDNLSITSLDRNINSSEYKGGDDLQTLRVDTTKGDDFSAFTTNGNTITTKGVTGSNITRLTLGAMNGLTYKQGDLEIVFTEGGATIRDGSNAKEIFFDKPLLLRGATVEISRIGDTVGIGFANAGAPLEAIDGNYYSASGFKVAGRENISISSNGEVKITKAAIFNLDSNVSIDARNFDAATDIMQPWVKRKSLQDKKGCGGVVGLSSALLFVPAVWILKRKNENA